MKINRKQPFAGMASRIAKCARWKKKLNKKRFMNSCKNVFECTPLSVMTSWVKMQINEKGMFAIHTTTVLNGSIFFFILKTYAVQATKIYSHFSFYNMGGIFL